MDSSAAELSSVATAVGELTGRVRRIADAYGQRKREAEAEDLYEVERMLSGAHRRLTRFVESG